MRTYVEKILILLGIHFILSVFLFSCTGGASGGFAPGNAGASLPQLPITTKPTSESIMNNSTLVTTANGWAVQADQTNPVHTKVLSNGWKIEARYE